MTKNYGYAVIATLTGVANACSVTLTSLASPSIASASSAALTPVPSSLPPLAVIRSDLLSHLTLIYTSTTKIALVLKPPGSKGKPSPTPSYSAARGPTEDLAKHVLSANACVSLLYPSTHGEALVKDARNAVIDVVEAVDALARTLITALTKGERLEDDAHLVRTAAVHELVDRAKGSEGIPVGNLSAVRRRWDGDRGTMEDALKELGEMIADSEGADEGFEEEDEDGWDELGLGGAKMSPEEVKRSKATQPLLKIINLIHKRVSTTLLTPSQTAPLTSLDTLVPLSSTLQAAYDDTIAAFYAPQNVATMLPAIRALVDATKALEAAVAPLLPEEDLSAQLGNLSIEETSESSKPLKASNNPRKWFATAFAQLDKLLASLEVELASTA